MVGLVEGRHQLGQEQCFPVGNGFPTILSPLSVACTWWRVPGQLAPGGGKSGRTGAAICNMSEN